MVSTASRVGNNYCGKKYDLETGFSGADGRKQQTWKIVHKFSERIFIIFSSLPYGERYVHGTFWRLLHGGHERTHQTRAIAYEQPSPPPSRVVVRRTIPIRGQPFKK